MEKTMEGWKPRKSIRRLRDTIQNVLGLKRNLTINWAESVCHIIENLLAEDAEANEQGSMKMGSDQSVKDELLVKKIQGNLAALEAQLTQLDLKRRWALNELLDLKGNIRVFCRIRPFLADEKYNNLGIAITSDSNNMLLKIKETTIKQYSFDRIFDQMANQEEVFSEIEPVIKSALDGFNVCIFAYGQTGTGKTFTMEGKSDSLGVIPRAIDALFEQTMHRRHKIQFSFSMLEIYMGNLRDLLASRNEKEGTLSTPPCLSIKTDSSGSIEIDNLVTIEVYGSEQMKKLYKLGSRLRTTAFTLSNGTSSRSHCLIRIGMKSFNDPQRRRETNKIWMVDLGGSERLLKTQARGRRLEEGKAINLSLSALGDVISALQRKQQHVPYRNSKLTQILNDSLGEDSKTLMLVHVSPKQEDLCETACSLSFATRVRSIHLGNEESKGQKVIQEAKIAALQKMTCQLESECQHTRMEICRYTEMLEDMDKAEKFNEKHLNPLPASVRGKNHDDHRNEKNSTDLKPGSKRAPRFMRPTICSNLKTGIEGPKKQNEKKIQTHPKRRKSSSMYAESITTKLRNELLGNSSRSSVQRTECSTYREDDTTECSQDALECEIKAIIFPEWKIPGTIMHHPVYSIDIDECHQEHSQEESSHLEVDNQVCSCILDAKIDYTCDCSDGLNLDTVGGNSSADSHPSCKYIDPEQGIINMDFEKGKPMEMELNCSSMHIPSPVLVDGDNACDNEVEQVRFTPIIWSQADNNGLDRRSSSVEEEGNKAPCDSNIKENSNIKYVCEPKALRADLRNLGLNSRRSQRALFLDNDLPFIDQRHKCGAPREILATTEGSKKGKCHFLEKMIQTVMANVLFAFGLGNIGLGDDFYYGLTF